MLEISSNGFMLQGNYVGCVRYADNILLFSAPPIKLQKMLDICNAYAVDYSLTFNGMKSWCMMYGKNWDYNGMSRMNIGGTDISWVFEGVYLGIKLIAGKSFKTDVEERKQKFIGSFNNVVANGYFMSEGMYYRDPN
jgi:hypothetical protein